MFAKSIWVTVYAYTTSDTLTALPPDNWPSGLEINYHSKLPTGDQWATFTIGENILYTDIGYQALKRDIEATVKITQACFQRKVGLLESKVKREWSPKMNFQSHHLVTPQFCNFQPLLSFTSDFPRLKNVRFRTVTCQYALHSKFPLLDLRWTTCKLSRLYILCAGLTTVTNIIVQ